MSELLRIDEIRASAEAAADAGERVDENPYKDDPRRAQQWRHFFFQRQSIGDLYREQA